MASGGYLTVQVGTLTDHILHRYVRTVPTTATPIAQLILLDMAPQGKSSVQEHCESHTVEGPTTKIEPASKKSQELIEHLRLGHPKFDESCEACVQAYMRAKRATRGALAEKDLETANIDTMFHAEEDNNGDLYSLNMVVV